MEPVSALQWVNAGSQLLNAVGGLQGKGAAPGYAMSGQGPSMPKSDVDFSGFTVATGRATANGATIKKNPTDTLGASDGGSGGGGFSPLLVIGLASLAGLMSGNSA